jgi:hypothetical protein
VQIYEKVGNLQRKRQKNLEVTEKLRIFAALKNTMAMKESKPYPRIEEEDGSCLTAQEPVAALAYADEAVEVKQRPIPGLPQSWNELTECLKEGEEAYERGEGILWEEAVQYMRLHRSYGS